MKKVAVGVDIGGTNSVYGLVDEAGEIICEGAFPTRNYPDFDQYIEELYIGIQDLLKRAGDEGELVGLGIGAVALAGDIVNTMAGSFGVNGNALKIGFSVEGGGFVAISALAIATVLAIVLNLIIPNSKPESEEQEIAKESSIVNLSSSAAVDMTEVTEGLEEMAAEEIAKEKKPEEEDKHAEE